MLASAGTPAAGSRPGHLRRFLRVYLPAARDSARWVRLRDHGPRTDPNIEEPERMRLVSTASLLALIIAGAPAAAQDPPAPPASAPAALASERDPEAIAALERMGAHLRTLTTFGVAGDITSEEVLQTGQSITYTGAIDLVAQRPNRLRANMDSSRKRRQYFYDGRTLTIWAPRQGFYTSVDAPGTIGEVLDVASERLNLVLPLADMFELGVDPELTGRLTSAFFVGVEAVDDQKCEHYAFRQPGVDWEIWIR